MDIVTPEDYWKSMRNERLDAFAPRSSDGPILKVFKTLFGVSGFHAPIETFLWWRLSRKNVLSEPLGSLGSRSAFNTAVELYWIVWTAILAGCYVLAWLACRDDLDSGAIVAFLSVIALRVAVALAIFRVMEILAVSFRLHLLTPYRTPSPAHAMIITFLAYVHAMIAFAVLFMAESRWMEDRFKLGTGLRGDPLDALYFSAVTITTLGYGDLSPERWAGKMLVLTEIAVGLILVVVAFQRVLGGFDFEHAAETRGDPSVNTPAARTAKIVKAAVVQAGSIPFDTPGTIEKLAALAADAARSGANLVVFPEAFVGGYPKGQAFGVAVGSRSPEGRETFRQYFEGAIAIPGAEFEALAAIARELAIHLVVGVIERDGGTLYCTALILGPDGRILGKHRKLVPTAMERVIWGSGDGSTMPVVPTSLGKIGAVICWENYMPLLRTTMYGKGVELYCAITVDDRETWINTIRHIAMEGRCFVLSSCQFLPGDREPTSESAGPLIRGGSAIVGPLGQLLAGPVYGQETILTVDLDLDDLARAKFDFDVVGHYARPDVFRLHVNEQARTSVEFDRGESPQSRPREG